MSTDLTHVVDPIAGLGNDSATTELLENVGYRPELKRSASCVKVDHHFNEVTSDDPNVIIMPLSEALVTYPWVQGLVWSLIDPNEDVHLRRAFESTRRPYGTFTWVRDGAKVELPTQMFTVMTVPQERQFVHDITVIGEGAEVSFVTGNAVAPKLTHGTHVSVSETFVGKGARVRSIDVERWGRHMNVRSYARTKIAEEGVMSSVSVAVSGIDFHRSDNRVDVGANAKCSDHSVIFAPEGTHRVMETTLQLTGDGAQAEQVSRMVADGGEIDQSTTLGSAVAGTRGFLQCDGLMLRESGSINSVPALAAASSGAQLSHEASVGMIDTAKLDYLMASGLDEDQARDLIVQGFLHLDDQEIPANIRETVEHLVAQARTAEL